MAAPTPTPTPTESNRTPMWCVGLHLPSPNNVIRIADVDAAISSNYDLVTSYITNKKFHARVADSIALAASLGQEVTIVDSLDEDEVSIHPGDHLSQVVAFTSPWLELDSDNSLVAYASKEALKHEVAYAAFCGLSYVIINGPKRKARASQFAQAISSVLSISAYMQLLIQMPVIGEDGSLDLTVKVPKEKSLNKPNDVLSVWDAWNTIRTICKYTGRLGLALQIAMRFPPQIQKRITDRWFTEPIKLLMISVEAFIQNGKGYPVLPKPTQQIIWKWMMLRPMPFIVLSDIPKVAPSQFETLPSPPVKQHRPELEYLAYIRHLRTLQPALSAVEIFGTGYQDYLQAPLQPLADNLESITYEVFEKDPVKYDQYEKAIRLALEQRDLNDTIVVAVVGAGRGPLVSRALKAAKSIERNIELYAIEKNQNAYVTLQRHNRETWQGKVTIVKSDMRSWHPAFQVDILISELLGSFGDNELSPECIDGVQRVLNPDGGITIPTSYSAYFTPIMAPKIYADISNRMTTDGTAAETPYVVMLHSAQLLAENQYIHKAWEFSHPIPQEILDANIISNDHNIRFSTHSFKIPDRGVIHGLAGYFESVLFGEVELSTRPDTIDIKSKDMISWFPIFFPLKTALYAPDLSEIDVSMWRVTDERKVWYEWLVEIYAVNNLGIRSRLSTSELHSSVKNACLM